MKDIESISLASHEIAMEHKNGIIKRLIALNMATIICFCSWFCVWQLNTVDTDEIISETQTDID